MTNETVVVIPIGAQCKEHGFHLPLNNDFVLAEYLKHAIVKRLPVLIAPTINYSYYPAMAEYPGTVSLESETASAMFVDIVRSFARFGPRNFYFLNTGISTIKPLTSAAEMLRQEDLNVCFTDLSMLMKEIRAAVEEQEGGSHADEIETSMMLFIAPEIVRMDKAVCDYQGDGDGPLSPKEKPGAVYSPTGAWGDPTRASKEKGEQLIVSLVNGIADDINQMFTAMASISNRL